MILIKVIEMNLYFLCLNEALNNKSNATWKTVDKQSTWKESYSC
jgi:hypothetical protein